MDVGLAREPDGSGVGHLLRTDWEWNRASLRTAVTEMRRRTSGRTVTLISVVHVGLREYYDAISRLIAATEAGGGVVLYEGLGSLSEPEIASLSQRERAIYRTLAPLHELYGAFAQSLGLVFQGEAIPYDRSRWVNADIPLRELLRRWEESGAPLLPLDAAGSGGLAIPNSRFARGISGLTLLQTPLMLAALNRLHGYVPALGKLRELLLSDRNRAALDALEQTSPDRDAVVLYGAGHMAGIRDGLELRGYRAVGQSWLTAFTQQFPWSEGLDTLREQTNSLQALWRGSRGR